MSLLKQISEDLVKAQKLKDELVVSVLRMLNAGIKNMEIALRPKPIEEADMTSVISKEMKKLRDSLEDFKKAARQDLVDKVEQEIKIIEKYLPRMMSEEEVRLAVSKVIAELKATATDFGKVMGAVGKELKGKAEGSVIAQVVKELLK